MPSRPTAASRAFVYTLFVIITVVTLWVPAYNRLEPSAFGIPFFYWFQLAWIGATAAVTFVAYRLKL